ncbi:MAG: hypothetical protein QOD69_3204, partial [Solirubrobacteraceae bacterium]|nr:hypothetical protein [Solirubrobacteraceae bacterium]
LQRLRRGLLIRHAQVGSTERAR